MQNFNKSYSPFYSNIHSRNFIPSNYRSFSFFPNTLKNSNSNFFQNNQESEKKSDLKNNNIQSNISSKNLPPNKDFASKFAPLSAKYCVLNFCPHLGSLMKTT